MGRERARAGPGWYFPAMDALMPRGMVRHEDRTAAVTSSCDACSANEAKHVPALMGERSGGGLSVDVTGIGVMPDYQPDTRGTYQCVAH